jgi:RNA polymerase-binding transcription factor
MHEAGRVTTPASGDRAAQSRIRDRRRTIEERLTQVQARLADVRIARHDWTDEEHDPEGFALTFEWQQAEGARARYELDLHALDAAEGRLRDGRYGLCDNCGGPIPDAQLEIRPERTTCVTCPATRS